MSLVLVVEGFGEVEAAPVLIRRLLWSFGCWDLEVATPFRVKRNHVVRDGQLEAAVGLAIASRPMPEAVLVLLDADDDAACQLGPALLRRVQDVARQLPAAVVLAEREYEGWFLAAKESLRGRCGIRDDAESPAACETIRDAKGELSRNMDDGFHYVPVEHQASLSDALDLAAAEGAARSFAKLVRDLRRLVNDRVGQ